MSIATVAAAPAARADGDAPFPGVLDDLEGMGVFEQRLGRECSPQMRQVPPSAFCFSTTATVSPSCAARIAAT